MSRTALHMCYAKPCTHVGTLQPRVGLRICDAVFCTGDVGDEGLTLGQLRFYPRAMTPSSIQIEYLGMEIARLRLRVNAQRVKGEGWRVEGERMKG
eukprot:1762002-Rhodomonas_salina.2